jgi:hypothetical protein
MAKCGAVIVLVRLTEDVGVVNSSQQVEISWDIFTGTVTSDGFADVPRRRAPEQNFFPRVVRMCSF